MHRVPAVIAAAVALVGLLPTPSWAQDVIGPPQPIVYFDGFDESGAPIVVDGLMVDGTEVAVASSRSADASCLQRWRFSSTVRYGSNWMTYNYASTAKTEGCGTYRASAHATLYKGDQRWDESFSAYTHPCANVSRLNATAITCSSPRFTSYPGHRWTIVSGHTFDVGADGTRNGKCDGCLDRLWVHR